MNGPASGWYDLYLDAPTHRANRFIERVWTTLQSMPEYANQTALVITTDHGRGATKKDWNNHGEKIPAAQRTWMAMLGNGVAPLGVQRTTVTTTRSRRLWRHWLVRNSSGPIHKPLLPSTCRASDRTRNTDR